MSDSSLNQRNSDSWRGPLWASAAVVSALIVVQAGRGPSTPEAFAGNVSESGPVRILTADAGNGDEYIALLDNSTETISVYGIENGRSLELYHMVKASDLFLQARGSNQGGSRR